MYHDMFGDLGKGLRIGAVIVVVLIVGAFGLGAWLF